MAKMFGGSEWIRIHIHMSMNAYTHIDTNICKLTGFSLAFISFFLINNNNNVNLINGLLLKY